MKVFLINIFILAFLVSCETVTTIDGPQTRERYKDFLSQYYKTDYKEDLFFSGKLRLKEHDFNSGLSANFYYVNKAFQNKKWLDLSKLTYSSVSSSNIGYYYLGVAAENMGYLDAAQQYFELAIGSYHPYSDFVVPGCELNNNCNGIDMPNDLHRSILRVSGNKPDLYLRKYLAIEESLVDWETSFLNTTSVLLVAGVFALAAYGDVYSEGYQSSNSSYSNSNKTIFDSNGNYWNIVGNTIIGPNGQYYNINGNVITGPNGQTSIISGNSLINSDGSIVTRAGNSYISSNGSMCTVSGSVVICN